MLKINGVTIVTPKGYEVSISDIDGETNRNANGTLIRDRIAVKRKLNLRLATFNTKSIFYSVECGN